MLNGRGLPAQKELQLDTIHSFSLGIQANIILTQADDQKIVIKGQENITDRINADVKDGFWDIDYEQNIGNFELQRSTNPTPTLGLGSIFLQVLPSSLMLFSLKVRIFFKNAHGYFPGCLKYLSIPGQISNS